MTIIIAYFRCFGDKFGSGGERGALWPRAGFRPENLAAERSDDKAEEDWEVEEKNARVGGGQLKDEGGFCAEKVDEVDMKIEEKSGKGRNGRDKKREKTSRTGEKDEQHSVRERGQDNKICDKGEEREGAEVKDKKRGTDKSSSETSDGHGGEPRRTLAAIEKLGEAGRKDKNAKKGGKGKLPAETNEVGWREEEGERRDEEN